MLQRHPFIRLLGPQVGGILFISILYEQGWLAPSWITPALTFFCLLLSVALCSYYFGRNKYVTLTTLSIHIALFSAGATATLLTFKAFHQELTAIDESPYKAALIKVSSLGQKKKNSVQYRATLLAVHANQQWESRSAKVLVSFASDPGRDLLLGKQFIVRNPRFRRPGEALNPGEFDYQKYLERQGIAWTLYVSDSTYVFGKNKARVPFYQWPLILSHAAESTFRNYLTRSSTLGLINAMLLGQRDEMGEKLLDSYIAAGAVHVLAVSGLHVGILFLLLTFLTKPLLKIRNGKYITLGITVLFLAFYAILTGLPPSVVRASLMCLVFAVSNTIQRSHQNLNSLALSAFLILLFDPLALYSVGFQLSYAAVLGILLFYPLFKNVVQTRFVPLRWLWQITLVSFSAQVFTFPISIYYFHQFPTYFWLVNPFVIGLTFILVYGAICLLVFSFLFLVPLAQLTALVVDMVASLMNQLVAIPQSLPHYLLRPLQLDGVEVVLLCLVGICFYLIIQTREDAYLKRAIVVSFILALYGMVKLLYDFSTSDVYFHPVAKHTVISFRKGQVAYVLADSPFFTDSMSMKAHLESYFYDQGITKIEQVALTDPEKNRSSLIFMQDQCIGLDTQHRPANEKWIVIRNKKYPTFDKQLTSPKPFYVLSPELGYKTRQRWEAILQSKQVELVNPMETGAIQF